MFRGLYVITDSGMLEGRIAPAVESALKGGAAAVQYRAKDRTGEHYRHAARELRALTRRYNAPLIINDDCDLAMEVDADGVHIGRDDVSLAEARKIVGSRLVGVSCYNRLALARQAESQGADYVAFGSVFGSPIKPRAVHAPVSLIARAVTGLTIPVVAIGGINADNCRSLIRAGVHAVAVVSGVFAQPDIERAAGEIAGMFTPTQDTT